MDPDFAERLRKQVTPKKATVCNFIELYILLLFLLKFTI